MVDQDEADNELWSPESDFPFDANPDDHAGGSGTAARTESAISPDISWNPMGSRVSGEGRTSSVNPTATDTPAHLVGRALILLNPGWNSVGQLSLYRG